MYNIGTTTCSRLSTISCQPLNVSIPRSTVLYTTATIKMYNAMALCTDTFMKNEPNEEAGTNSEDVRLTAIRELQRMVK